ncbi:MAG: hypothetical protein AAF849_21105 [Bacteroidota bacterium]
MQDRDLDKIIGDKLGDLDLPYKFGSWDALEQKMEASKFEEQFDENIRHKLSDLDLSHQPMYWDMLAHRLEQEAALRNQLIRYKVSEVLLVFLILITFVQFFPDPTLNYKFFADKNTEVASSLNDKYIVALDSDNHTVDNEGKSSYLTSHTPFESKTEESVKAVGQPSALNPLQHAFVSPIVAASQENNNDLAAIKEKWSQSLASLSKEQLASLAEQETVVLLIENSSVAAIPITEVINKQKSHFRLGIYTNANIDHIQTPYDEIFDLAPLSQHVFGYGGGISFAWKKKRWELETALAFNHKQYVPMDDKAVKYDDLIEDLTNFYINAAQISTQVRYDVVQSKEKWQFYVLGGTSLNLVTQSSYHSAAAPALQLNVRAEVENANLTLDNNQQKLFEKNSQHLSSPNAPEWGERKFSNGLLHGGKYRDNNYITADIGFGAERQLDERFSLFVQPTYRQNINLLKKGLGPNQDRVSTFQLIVGTKVGF